MIEQHIRMPVYGWNVTVFYDVRPRDIDGVCSFLEMIGCPEMTIRKAERNMLSGPDTGVTYTNGDSRETVVILSRATSSGQFMNTMSHEIGHAVQHIGSLCGLPEDGEDRQYLAGFLAQRFHAAARCFLCDQDRPS